MKFVSILFILAALIAAVSGAACGSSLSKKECNTCTEGTHLFGCNTCDKCTSDSAACTSDCADKGFKTEGTKCLKCTAIVGCARDQITCGSTATGVTANSNVCKQCMDGYKKGAPTSKDNVCVKIGIENCATGNQDCTLNT